MTDYWDYVVNAVSGIADTINRAGDDFGRWWSEQSWGGQSSFDWETFDYLMDNVPPISWVKGALNEKARNTDIRKNANGRQPAYETLFNQGANTSALGSMASFGARRMARDAMDLYPPDVVENVNKKKVNKNVKNLY